MQFNVSISFDAAALAALNSLAAAIQSIAGGAQVVSKPVATIEPLRAAAEETAAEAETTGPIYWADNSTGDFGKVETEAEYQARKAKNPGVYKITESIHEQKVVELRAKNEAAAQAKKEAKAAAKAEKEAKAKAENEATAEASDTTTAENAGAAASVSKDEVLEAYRAFLPADLPADQQAERKRFVRAIVDRFGVKLIRELDPAHYALALNLVQRKMAGEDIDPESATFTEVAPYYEKTEGDDLV